MLFVYNGQRSVNFISISNTETESTAICQYQIVQIKEATHKYLFKYFHLLDFVKKTKDDHRKKVSRVNAKVGLCVSEAAAAQQSEGSTKRKK